MTASADTTRICIVAGVVDRYDALSEAVLSNLEAAGSMGNGVEARVYCRASSVADSRIYVIGSLAELMAETFYQSADVIIHHFGIINELHDALALAPRSARLLVEFHGVTPPQFLPDAARDLIHASFQQMELFANADEILVHTDYLEREVRRVGIERPFSKIELFGVNVGEASVLPPERAAAEPLRLLFCGRFVRSKQVVELLQAVVALALDHGSLELTLVGVSSFSDAAYTAALDAACEDLPDNVTVLIRSNLRAEAVAEAIAGADLLVLPSLHEGFGMPVAEALAAGTPVVCSDAGSLPEVAGGLAAIHVAGDEYDLQAVLGRALAARERGRVLCADVEIDYPAWRERALAFASKYRRVAYEQRWREHLMPLVGKSHRPTSLAAAAHRVLAPMAGEDAAPAPIYGQTLGLLIGGKVASRERNDIGSAVGVLHQWAFDRPMEEGDRDHWLASQDGPASIGEIERRMFSSPEVQGSATKRRELSGIQTALSRSASSTPEAPMGKGLPGLTRDEVMQATAGARSDQAFLGDVYQLVLGRMADDEGFKAYLDALASGLTREACIDDFMQSEEYQLQHG